MLRPRPLGLGDDDLPLRQVGRRLHGFHPVLLLARGARLPSHAFLVGPPFDSLNGLFPVLGGSVPLQAWCVCVVESRRLQRVLEAVLCRFAGFPAAIATPVPVVPAGLGPHGLRHPLLHVPAVARIDGLRPDAIALVVAVAPPEEA